MKQRLSTADVAGEVACLRARIMGMRVVNVYDINPKVCAARQTYVSNCSFFLFFQISIHVTARNRPELSGPTPPSAAVRFRP
jgi:hypothetical protein